MPISSGLSQDSTDGTAPCIIHHNQTETYIIVDVAGTLIPADTIMNLPEISKDLERH